MKIRRVRTPAEFKRVDALARRHGPFRGKPPSSFVATWAVLLPDGAVPVAFASADVYFEEGAPSRPSRVALTTAGVHRDWRGSGFQRALIKTRVRWARRIGAHKVTTYCSADNGHSLGNLLRCGFVVVGYRSDPTAYGGGWVDCERVFP